MSNQVFVRNLSFSCSEEQLSGIFESFGPLRRVSLAREPSGISKGFGFVKFAMEEDAVKAVDALQDHELEGRKLKLEIAVKKGSKEEEQKRQELESRKKRKPVAPTPAEGAEDEEVGDAKKVAAHVQVSKPSQQVLAFGLPESVRASTLQASILASGIKRIKVQLITKVCCKAVTSKFQ
jgi:RNA recognition motif-containing protein